MKVYDLDKTQEWLNRTMQIGKEPPVRGGLKPDRSRRQTLLALAGVLMILAGGILLAPRLRSASPTTSEQGKLKPADGVTRVLPPPVVSPVPSTVDQTGLPLSIPLMPIAPSTRFGFDAPELDLSGGIRPLPGHVAPHVPLSLGDR